MIIKYICTRTMDEPIPEILSDTRDCPECGRTVWINPDKFAAAEERAEQGGGQVNIICTLCYGEQQAEKQEQQTAVQEQPATAEDATAYDETTEGE
jgi:hypothetical protein